MKKNNTLVAAQAVLLLLAAIFLYLPSLSYDFTLDDPLVTTINQDVAAPEPHYADCFKSSLYHGTFLESANANLYRPVLKLSMLANRQLAGGAFDPRSFHLVNVLLYGMAVVAVFLFYRALLPPEKEGVAAGSVALLATLLFLVFPSHIESVCNIKHREEIISCLFGLSSWTIFLRPREGSGRHGWNLFGALLLLLALLSKESAVLLIPCMLIWEHLNQRLRQRSTLEGIGIYLAAVTIYAVMRISALHAVFSPSSTYTFFMPGEGLFTRFGVSCQVFVRHYLVDQLAGFQIDPAFSNRNLLLADGLVNLQTCLSMAVVVVMGAALLWYTLQRRNQLAALGLFFLVASFLTFNIIPTGTAGAYRLMFTPSVFLCGFLALLLLRASSGLTQSAQSGGAKIVVTAAVVLGIASLALVTRNRMTIWRDDGTLFGYSGSLGPHNPQSLVAAGNYYQKVGDQNRKLAFYQKALEEYQSDVQKEYIYDDRTTNELSMVATEVGYANLSADPGRAVELADLAIVQFRRLQRLRNGYVDENTPAPYYVKALALIKLSQPDKAMIVCREGLAIADHPGLRNLLQNTKVN